MLFEVRRLFCLVRKKECAVAHQVTIFQTSKKRKGEKFQKIELVLVSDNQKQMHDLLLS